MRQRLRPASRWVDVSAAEAMDGDLDDVVLVRLEHVLCVISRRLERDQTSSAHIFGMDVEDDRHALVLLRFLGSELDRGEDLAGRYEAFGSIKFG